MLEQKKHVKHRPAVPKRGSTSESSRDLPETSGPHPRLSDLIGLSRDIGICKTSARNSNVQKSLGTTGEVENMFSTIHAHLPPFAHFKIRSGT